MSGNKGFILKILGRVFTPGVIKRYDTVKGIIHNAAFSRTFKDWGEGSYIAYPINLLHGAEYISVGNRCTIGKYVQLTAWSRFKTQQFRPEIIIGDNTSIGDFSHITAINSIRIGRNVLTGKNILITDNAHGESERNSIDTPPKDRPLVSKGGVVIEDNVWIGEKVSIMPGVTIGYGSIIGTGSVVTRDIPTYSVAVGNPAKVIKKLI